MLFCMSPDNGNRRRVVVNNVRVRCHGTNVQNYGCVNRYNDDAPSCDKCIIVIIDFIGRRDIIRTNGRIILWIILLKYMERYPAIRINILSQKREGEHVLWVEH